MDILQALSNKEIQQWLHPDYRNKKAVEEIKKRFKNSTPFHHIELEHFFDEKKCANILKALKKEEFLEKESDLFKFMQTHDLQGTENKTLQEFRIFLSSEAFISYMETITEIELKKESIDLSASMYQNTDYLLPHDDQLQGRKIAFMLYLSTLEAKDGGKLILYNTKGGKPQEEEKAITPQCNKCVFFKVCENSFHEVEEVITNKQRITLGGWFHGKHYQPKLLETRQY